jgi:hypothetical protein
VRTDSKNWSGWVPWVLPGTLVLGACFSAACSSGGEGAPEGSARVGTASSELRSTIGSSAAFEFFTAARSGSGYVVSAVNGGTFACGSQRATACRVPAIDISALGLGAGDVKTILGLVGRDPSSPEVLFVGSVGSNALVVQEVWRAPAAVHLPSGSELLLVSHQAPSQALVVNSWSPARVGALDFSAAAEAECCDAPDDGGGPPCSLSYFPVTTDVVAPTGVVLTGWTGSNGTLHVEQYFLKISTGYEQLGDGYSFCSAGDQVCTDGRCFDPDGGACNHVHWAGRGESPAYSRATSTSVESWLLATGQLQLSDLPGN